MRQRCPTSRRASARIGGEATTVARRSTDRLQVMGSDLVHSVGTPWRWGVLEHFINVTSEFNDASRLTLSSV
jgi:hypothetical protein